MTIIRKVMPAQVSNLGDDEVEVIISTGQRARDGHIFEPGGCQLENYRRNPIVLWQHDPLMPVGRAEDVRISGDKIVGRVRFAPAGVSPKADEVRGLVKSGVVSGVSVGMDPIEAEPIDQKQPRGGQIVRSWEMLEFSFCSVPVDTDAVVTARALERDMADDWKVGASRNLPIEDSDAWDGPAAEASIFEHAGGDKFDPAKARKGFLVYNASKPDERGSYKLPIAHVADGELKVPKGAIRAAASRLPDTDIPDDVKKRAQGVLDHYRKEAGIGDEEEADAGERSAHPHLVRGLPMPGMKRAIIERGLWQVGWLAQALQQLGCIHSDAEFEAEIEGDNSPVPGMLGEALVGVGKALIAMTEEEVAELLAGKDLELGDDDDIPIDERAFVAAGKTPRTRAWRRGVAMARAGRVLSATNKKRLETAASHHERALKHHEAMAASHDAMAGHMDAITEKQAKAQAAQDQMGDAIAAAKEKPDDAGHMDRAMKHAGALAEHVRAIGEMMQDMTDAHADMGDSHAAMGRSLKAAQRTVRSVIDGASVTDNEMDQTEADGERSLDIRRRELALMEAALVR